MPAIYYPAVRALQRALMQVRLVLLQASFGGRDSFLFADQSLQF